LTGGKKELCETTRSTVAGLQLLPHSMNVEYTAVKSKQQLSNPWTGDVSYSEHRTFTIPGADVSLRTVSEDEITLVQTFSGVKLRKLKSQVFRAEST
jgi:ribosomal protein L7Ae-like RNA K-turn-binding protein